MAVKKTELYSSLWASCDALRGGMDALQYKDYILTLLFMKYVTDKYKGQKYGDLIVFDKANDPNPDPEKRTGCSFDDFIALKNKKNIGEGIDKIIARLAEVNEGLKGVIDIAHFNDETKIGKNKEMVDKLTKLISIFQRPELDFSKNKAEGDDIIGDAYEYLMRNFASESGKSKGQFYTPAEVSRILAKIIGIDKCSDHDATVCDPACGSGSLLIRALEEAPFEISGYGQEKDSSTAGLAKMNAVLHNKATIKIMAGNTFSFVSELNEKLPEKDSFYNAFSLVGWSHHGGFYDDDKDKERVKIVLEVLERHKSAAKNCEKFTIEHILDDQDDTKNGRIGNLIPLEEELNKQCNGKKFKEKLTIYKKSSFQTARNIAERYAIDKGRKFDIDERTHAIARDFYNEVLKFKINSVDSQKKKTKHNKKQKESDFSRKNIGDIVDSKQNGTEKIRKEENRQMSIFDYIS